MPAVAGTDAHALVLLARLWLVVPIRGYPESLPVHSEADLPCQCVCNPYFSASRRAMLEPARSTTNWSLLLLSNGTLDNICIHLTGRDLHRNNVDAIAAVHHAPSEFCLCCSPIN
jgi:hypothetical protein